jgi:Multidrug resistance efflux pump
MDKRKIVGPAVLLALVVILAAGAAGCRMREATPEGQTASPAVSTPGAETETPAGGAVVSGKLEAWQCANIVPKVPGKVARVHVDVGSRVSAGQVLVTLENKDLADRVAQAEAGVKQAEAGVKQATAVLEQLQAGLKSAQAALENAVESYRVAEANYRRAKELLAAGAIPQAVFEGQYELPYKQAKQTAEVSAPAQVELVQAQLAGARAALENAQAVLKNAQAQQALARSAYEDSFIRAPFGGVVTARNINPGEMASTTPVISLADLDKVVVKAAVGEKFINQLKIGQKVRVKISAVRPEFFTGTVTHIGPAADPATKAFPVKVEIANPDHVLKPGMFAEVYLTAAGQK